MYPEPDYYRSPEYRAESWRILLMVVNLWIIALKLA
jgi:hypothetical protein